MSKQAFWFDKKGGHRVHNLTVTLEYDADKRLCGVKYTTLGADGITADTVTPRDLDTLVKVLGIPTVLGKATAAKK